MSGVTPRAQAAHDERMRKMLEEDLSGTPIARDANRFPPDPRFPTEGTFRMRPGDMPYGRPEYMATEPPFEVLDDGIREVVRALWHAGFHPTDSGDGVSKREMIADGCALTVPHVFMVVPEPARLFDEANRLHVFVARRFYGGIGPIGEQGCANIQASYDPAIGTAILELYGVTGKDLRP